MIQQFLKRPILYGIIVVNLIIFGTILAIITPKYTSPTIQPPYGAIKRSSVKSHECFDTFNRTLVVIIGRVRTFAHVWESVLLNLIQPNEPCDVILSIDGKREDIPDVVLQGLGPHIISILTTESEKPVGYIEFWHMARVIQKVSVDRYRFLIKTRTDLYHRIPISLKTLFAETTNFMFSLREFHKVLMNKTGQMTISVGETLYAWMMTGGMTEFIPPMMISTPSGAWSKLSPHDWNRNLRTTLGNCSTSTKLAMEHESAEKDAQIVKCLHITLKKHKVLYNIGSPWLQFGYISYFMSLAPKSLKEFGTHTWADMGFNDSDTISNNQWKHVPESQIRLTYLKMDFNVIDLYNHPDFEQSFRSTLTFQQARLTNSLLFFIVREWSVTTPKPSLFLDLFKGNNRRII